jgi:hypothetical protein
MKDLNSLREIAQMIPSAQSCYIHPDILVRMVSHRNNILLSQDPDLVIDYISRSTDEECLAVLAGIEYHAPLTANYQRVFSHLARRVFSAAGLEIPAPVRLTVGDSEELTIQQKVLLEQLRIEIRAAQLGMAGGGSLQ